MNRRSFLVRSGGCALLALNAGCAQWPRAGDSPASYPRGFELVGRLAARNGAQALSAALRWRHEFDADDLAFATPLGQTIAELRSDANEAVLTDAQGTTYRDRSIERLMQRALGWSVPVASLSYWVHGEASLASASIERDADGRTVRIEQDGWDVRIPAHVEDAGRQRPARLAIGRDALDLRLAIDRMTLAPTQ